MKMDWRFPPDENLRRQFDEEAERRIQDYANQVLNRFYNPTEAEKQILLYEAALIGHEQEMWAEILKDERKSKNLWHRAVASMLACFNKVFARDDLR